MQSSGGTCLAGEVSRASDSRVSLNSRCSSPASLVLPCDPPCFQSDFVSLFCVCFHTLLLIVNLQMIFEMPFEDRRGATLSWRNLSVYVANRDQKTIGKRLVNNVCGIVKPGELTAILGGSGAGKSSLMTALGFRTGPGIIVLGDVCVNGQLVDSSYMRRHSGFMHQEDIFVESTTVLEHLSFMARMKLDRRTRWFNIRRKIEELLREVGLGHRRDSRIEKLSGGERKRLAFATELLTDPSILFLDEPTTGQDAHSAALLVTRLAGFAAEGRTVVTTIHQPSSLVFEHFRRLILLAQGRIAFAGSTERAIQFFAGLGYECPLNYNPADFLLATLGDRRMRASDEDVAKKICDAYLRSEASNEIELSLELELRLAHFRERVAITNPKDEENEFKEPRWWTRSYWLIHRGFLQVSRDPSVQLARILQKMIVATIAGLCFVGAVNLDQRGIQAVQGVLFILVSENTFFPMYATLSLIPQELPLFLREYRAGMYPVHLYYLARTVSLIPGVIAEPVLFTAILYWLAGLRNTINAFTLSVLVVILTMNVSTACGCFFSAAFESVPLAMAYLVPFDYVLMITMGPFVKLGTLPIYLGWIRHLSWLLHSTEALSILQWTDVHNISCDATDSELPCLTEGEQVLDRYDFEETRFWVDVILMIVIYVAFHLLGYVCLCRRCRSE